MTIHVSTSFMSVKYSGIDLQEPKESNDVRFIAPVWIQKLYLIFKYIYHYLSLKEGSYFRIKCLAVKIIDGDILHLLTNWFAEDTVVPKWPAFFIDFYNTVVFLLHLTCIILSH